MRTRTGQKGVAMVTAIVLALIVSVLVAGVLSLTMRRFELSAFRTDHSVAAATSEAGLQYAFAWLQVPANQVLVQNAGAAGYRITGDAAALPWFENGVQIMGAETVVVPALTLGNKVIAIEIVFQAPPTLAGRPYRIRSVARFGTGTAF